MAATDVKGDAMVRVTLDWRDPNLIASRFWPNRGFRPQYHRLYRALP